MDSWGATGPNSRGIWIYWWCCKVSVWLFLCIFCFVKTWESRLKKKVVWYSEVFWRYADLKNKRSKIFNSTPMIWSSSLRLIIFHYEKLSQVICSDKIQAVCYNVKQQPKVMRKWFHLLGITLLFTSFDTYK